MRFAPQPISTWGAKNSIRPPKISGWGAKSPDSPPDRFPSGGRQMRFAPLTISRRGANFAPHTGVWWGAKISIRPPARSVSPPTMGGERFFRGAKPGNFFENSNRGEVGASFRVFRVSKPDAPSTRGREVGNPSGTVCKNQEMHQRCSIFLRWGA